MVPGRSEVEVVSKWNPPIFPQRTARIKAGRTMNRRRRRLVDRRFVGRSAADAICVRAMLLEMAANDTRKVGA